MTAQRTYWWEDKSAPFLCLRCSDPAWRPEHDCCVVHNVGRGQKCPACESSKALNRKAGKR